MTPLSWFVQSRKGLLTLVATSMSILCAAGIVVATVMGQMPWSTAIPTIFGSVFGGCLVAFKSIDAVAAEDNSKRQLAAARLVATGASTPAIDADLSARGSPPSPPPSVKKETIP